MIIRKRCSKISKKDLKVALEENQKVLSYLILEIEMSLQKELETLDLYNEYLADVLDERQELIEKNGKSITTSTLKFLNQPLVQLNDLHKKIFEVKAKIHNHYGF